ncbi:MAG: Na+/H+ antiporter subunit C [Gammaproteobacteria bacterium]
MEALLASGIGVLATAGIYLMLRARSFDLVLGLSLLSYAVNLTLFAMGRLTVDAEPILGTGNTYADPLPQALVLTAIVIGFGMTALILVLALAGHSSDGTDHVDGTERDP